MRTLKQIQTEHNSLVAASVEQLPEQIIWTLDHWPKKNPVIQRPFRNVIICGMGGSALAGDLLRYIYWRQLRVPVIIVNNYELPSFVSADSLIIVASYSGSTEEAISCFHQARQRRLSQIVITSGNKLGELAINLKVPHFIFDTKFNPCGQPRLGLGYFVGAFAASLKNAGVLKLELSELRRAAKKMKGQRSAITKQASKLLKKNCLLLASEHLVGAAHIISNQLNETDKLFASYFALPEMNHHLIEGLSGLGAQSKHWLAIMLESSDYHPRTKKRYRLTQTIFKKLGIATLAQSFSGTTLEQGLKFLWWSSFVSLQVALKERRDAGEIPLVDLLKKQLGRY